MSREIYILLAPRANMAQDGHFYWYLYRVIRFFKQEKKNAMIIVSGASPIHELYSLVDNSLVRIVRVEDSAEWGYDTGSIRPLKLSKLFMKSTSKDGFDIQESDHVIFFSNETSLTSLLSMLLLMQKNPNFSVMLNLIDFGFWKKIIYENRFLRLLWKPIARMINQKNLFLATNSPALFEVLREQGIESIKLWKYYQLSDPDYSFKINQVSLGVNRKNMLCQILVLPWPENSDLVLAFIKQLLLNTEFHGCVRIHLKKNDSIQPYLELKEKLHLNESQLILTQGVLDGNAYMSLLNQASAIWFPYNSSYHAESGSGRAIDALVSGTPILIDEKSNLFSVLESEILDFVIPVDCSNVSLVSEKCVQIAHEFSSDSICGEMKHRGKQDISEKIRLQFSAKAMFDDITSTLSRKRSNRVSNSTGKLLGISLNIYFYLVYIPYIIKKGVHRFKG